MAQAVQNDYPAAFAFLRPQKGRPFIDPENYEKSYAYLAELANNGHLESQFQIAQFNRFNIDGGSASSYTLGLYKEAAKKGHAEAHLVLADIYNDRASNWFNPSLRDAVLEEAFRNGVLNVYSISRWWVSRAWAEPKHNKEAKRWFERGVTQRDICSIREYARRLNGAGPFEPDKNRAQLLFNHAKDLGFNLPAIQHHNMIDLSKSFPRNGCDPSRARRALSSSEDKSVELSPRVQKNWSMVVKYCGGVQLFAKAVDRLMFDAHGNASSLERAFEAAVLTFLTKEAGFEVDANFEQQTLVRLHRSERRRATLLARQLSERIELPQE